MFKDKFYLFYMFYIYGTILYQRFVILLLCKIRTIFNNYTNFIFICYFVSGIYVLVLINRISLQ